MIIDASVAFKVLVEEDGTPAAKALVADREMFAPYLILSELGNALWKSVRRGSLARLEAGIGVATIPSLISLIDESEVMERASDLAIDLAHPVYDCVYLACAEARGEKLITADRKFLRALAGTSHEALIEEFVG